MSDKRRGGSAREILGRTQSVRQRSLKRGSPQAQEEAAEASTRSVDAATASAAKGRGAKKREGTKRITVDLPREEHKFLRDYAYENETDGMRVVRALLMELRGDSGLSGRVLTRLANLETRDR